MLASSTLPSVITVRTNLARVITSYSIHYTKLYDKPLIEKWIVREAFKDFLPPEITWRQKEQFSDGVGYNWIDTLKKMTSESVTSYNFV